MALDRESHLKKGKFGVERRREKMADAIEAAMQSTCGQCTAFLPELCGGPLDNLIRVLSGIIQAICPC
jgi:hypothetical protein